MEIYKTEQPIIHVEKQAHLNYNEAKTTERCHIWVNIFHFFLCRTATDHDKIQEEGQELQAGVARV